MFETGDLGVDGRHARAGAASSSGSRAGLQAIERRRGGAHAIGGGLDPRLGELAPGHRVVALLLRAGAVPQQLLESRFVGARRGQLGFRRLLIGGRGGDLRLGLLNVLDARPASSSRTCATACARSARAR